MEFFPTKLEGCFLIQPKVINDDRGYFMECFNERVFEKGTGMNVHFVQDNQSFSTKNVLRGLHYQTGESSQAKLVRVITGKVLDVAVDIRPESKTYGQSVSVELCAEKQNQIFIPRGFAHGFVVLSDTATFFYKCDNFYDRDAEAGVIFNEPEFAIDWGLPEDKMIISEKDRNQPSLENSRKFW